MGIGCKKNIPMEFVTESGSISNNLEDVLRKWESCFSQLCTSNDTSNEPLHEKTNKSGCVPSEDTDQPRHPPSLISLRCPHEESLGP